MTTWDRASPLFQQHLSIEVVSHSTNAATSRKQPYTLRILTGNRHVSHANERVLRFELSNEYNFVRNGCGGNSQNNNTINGIHINSSVCHNDENNLGNSICNPLSRFSVSDCVELYELEISEQDFQSLRRDQALRIDYVNFAESLISLLMNCTDGNDSSSSAAVTDHNAFMNTNHHHHHEYEDTLNSDANNQNSRKSELYDRLKDTFNQTRNEPLFTFGNINGCRHQMNQQLGSPIPSTTVKEKTRVPVFQTPSTSSFTSSIGAVPYVCRLEIWSDGNENDGKTRNHNSFGVRSEDNKANWSGLCSNRDKKARFSIIESNQFRELTHISLNLRPGIGESITTYLSARLVQMLQTNNLLQCRLDKESARADAAEQSLDSTNEELHRLSVTSEAEKREMRLQAGESAQAVEKKRTEEFRLVIVEKDEIIRELHEKLETLKLESQNRLDSLENTNRKQLKEKYEADSRIDQLQGILDTRESEMETLSKRLDDMSTKFRLSEDERQKVERKLHQSELRIASLEKATENQEEMINKAEALRKAAESAISLEKNCAHMNKTQLDQVNEQLEAAISEINRGNEIIKKFRKDRKETKKKLKDRTNIVRKQEEVIAKKDDELNRCKKELHEISIQLEEEKYNCNIHKKEIQDKNTKLEESAKLLESNQQVIAWLNREINEAHLGGKGFNTSGRMGNTSINSFHTDSFPTDIKVTSSSKFDTFENFQPSFDPQF